MNAPRTPARSPTPARRSIAWDHVAVSVPGNWELAAYRFPSSTVTRIELEDEYAVRLEAEWTRPRRKRHVDRLMKRYTEQTQALTTRAHEQAPLKDLPAGWSATRYIFRRTEADEGLTVTHRELATAVYAHPEGRLVAFFLVHFLPDDPEDPEDIVRLLARDSAYLGDAPMVRWEVYDMAVEMPREFLLENTFFDIGSKLLVFRWRGRRFYLWQFSCADMFVTPEKTLEEWFAGYLNSFPHIKGIIFMPGSDGEMLWRRRFPAIFAHRDEIARWCFRYAARCRHDRESNRVIAWVFSHRRDEDLKTIPAALRFGRHIAWD